MALLTGGGTDREGPDRLRLLAQCTPRPRPPGAPLSRSQRPPPSAPALRAGLALQLSRRLLAHPGSTRSWPRPPRPEEPTAGTAWRSRSQSTRPGPRAGLARRRARRHQPRGTGASRGVVPRRSPAALPAAPQPRAGPRLLWPKLPLRTLGTACPDWLLGFNALKSSRGALGLEGLFGHVWPLSVLQDKGRPSRRPGVLPLSPRSSVGACPRSGAGAAGRATGPDLLRASDAGSWTQAVSRGGAWPGARRLSLGGGGVRRQSSGSALALQIALGPCREGPRTAAPRRRRRARAEAGFRLAP